MAGKRWDTGPITGPRKVRNARSRGLWWRRQVYFVQVSMRRFLGHTLSRDTAESWLNNAAMRDEQVTA